jgi:GNAT superfamily N-acetyltransferase
VRLINEAFRVEDFFIVGNRTSHDDIAARMSAPHSCFIVSDAANADDLAGAVFVYAHGLRGHLSMLSVARAFQGHGVGRTLVDAVEKHCRSKGCATLELGVVNLRLELPPFYAKLGFTPSGTAPFPNTEKLRRDAHLILMTKSLNSV